MDLSSDKSSKIPGYLRNDKKFKNKDLELLINGDKVAKVVVSSEQDETNTAGVTGGSEATPFYLVKGKTYTIVMQEFGQYKFSNWEDNDSTNRARAVPPESSTMTLTAIYYVVQYVRRENEKSVEGRLFLSIFSFEASCFCLISVGKNGNKGQKKVEDSILKIQKSPVLADLLLYPLNLAKRVAATITATRATANTIADSGPNSGTTEVPDISTRSVPFL